MKILKSNYFKALLGVCGLLVVFQNCSPYKIMDGVNSITGKKDTGTDTFNALDASALKDTSCSAQAVGLGNALRGPELTLFDFAVYSSDGIAAQSSGYRGLVGSGGNIAFTDFLLDREVIKHQLPKPFSECSAFSRTKVTFVDGSALKLIGNEKVDTCIEAPVVEAERVIFSGGRNSVSVNYDALNAEMKKTSQRLANDIAQKFGSSVVRNNVFRATQAVNIFTVSAADFTNELRVEFHGNADQVFIINITGKSATVFNKGFYATGDVRPANIIWNFVDADTVVIADSGAKPGVFGADVGIPGTVLAPYALVSFHRSRITGGLYAAFVNGSGRDNVRAQAPLASNSAQAAGHIEKACFQGGATGIGCMTGETCNQPLPVAKACVASLDGNGGKSQIFAQTPQQCLGFCATKGSWSADERRDWNVCWFDKGYVHQGKPTGKTCVASLDHNGGQAPLVEKQSAEECLDYCRDKGTFSMEDRRTINVCWYGDRFVHEPEPRKGYSCVASTGREGQKSAVNFVGSVDSCRGFCNSQGPFSEDERREWNLCWLEDHFIH